MQASAQVASSRLPAGPRAAIKRTADCLANVDDRVAWVEKARTEAIIGGCLGSLDSVKSGIRCYLAFATDILKKERRLPPSVDDLLAWSIMFRCKDTFSNYLGYLRLGCLLEGVSVAAFGDPAIRRAKRAVAAGRQFRPREKLFVRSQIVEDILAGCSSDLGFDSSFGVLFLVSYVFMLRLPSEALPMVRGGDGNVDHGQQQSTIFMDGDELCLKLRKRKNKPWGSLLRRSCWCASGPSPLCPVHVVWDGFFANLDVGVAPFAAIKASHARNKLRLYLLALGVADAPKFRCHDLRRGHADDLRASGAPLAKMLLYGEWARPAYMKYVDDESLEASAVLQAHVDESSSEDED